MTELNKDVITFLQIIDDFLPSAFANKALCTAAIHSMILDLDSAVLKILSQHFPPASFRTLIQLFYRHRGIAGHKDSDRFVLSRDTDRENEHAKCNDQ